MNVLTTHWSDLNRTLVEDPEMPALWLRPLRSFDDLDGPSKQAPLRLSTRFRGATHHDFGGNIFPGYFRVIH
jgi:hypothetical protein